MAYRLASLVGALFVVGQAASASELTIGAYAVANHSSCGAGNIPGTVRELDKFFADANFPADAKANFYWKDARVYQQDWLKESDYRESTETKLGYDGADSSLLTYIASHGITSKGVYKALAGSRNNGGCYIPSNSLELGNNSSRYTILSTCQGLKIGNGDNPTATGENPSVTWKSSAPGTSCILGYSNNMADKDSYGTYLLAKLKEGNVSLAEAFMASSEAVSAQNVPAVLCFGETKEDAEAFIKDNKTFDGTSRSNAASAFVYRKKSSVAGHLKNAKESFPSIVDLVPAPVSVNRLSKAFLGSSFKSATKSPEGTTSYYSEEGTASYSKATNVLSVKNNVAHTNKADVVPAVDEAKEIANNVLAASGLGEEFSLVFESSTEDVLGSEAGLEKVLARKIQYRQELAGFQTLSQAGTVEVTVGPGGVVTEVKTSLFKVRAISKSTVSAAKVSASNDNYEATALQRVANKVPGGEYKVISTSFGYDAGNFFEVKPTARAVVEVTVEATQGGFSRRYVETIAL